MATEPRAVRPDLESTVVDPESREVSQALSEQAAEVDDIRHRFIPRSISNCSWDCTRDVVYAVGSGTVSAVLGVVASESSDETAKTLCGVFSTIFGVFAIAKTIYGITIRRCPHSQKFWFRS